MAQKMSMQKIADRLGVSKYTVSRALSGKDGVGEATRREVAVMAAALGYRLRPGEAAEPEGGPARQSGTVRIGMDERHADEPMFWLRVKAGLEAGCRENGLLPRFFSFGSEGSGNRPGIGEAWEPAETADGEGPGPAAVLAGDQGRESAAGADAAAVGPDAGEGAGDGELGYIVAGNCPQELLLRMRKSGKPIVLVDNEEPVIGADAVLNANVEAGRMACTHLLSQGCRSVVFVGRDGFSVSFRERFWGCRLALDELRRDVGARTADYPPARPAAAAKPASGGTDALLRKWTVPYGKASWQPALEKKLAAALSGGGLPDGFVCANDDLALRLLELLHGAGLAAPADCRVVGIDNTAASAEGPVPLTTVDLAKERLGMRAVEAFVRRRGHPEAGPEKVILAARLIVRQSG